MTTTLQRLLKYPHAAVFDKSPVAELALRLRHPDGAVWSIAEGVLTVTVGAAHHTYDLSLVSVGQLCADLESDGFEVLSISPMLAGKSAMVLVEGQGDQLQSNGDHISGFTSLLWAIFSAYSGELRAAKAQIGEALRQMVITQAEGEWLDLWGALYAQERMGAESDADFAERIPKEAFRIRVNKFGIEDAIKDATGFDVRIDEPWKEIFTLDQSTLSGPDRLYDGARYGYHLIRPFTRQHVDWPAVLKVINLNRAAGVLVIESNVVHGTHVDGTGAVVASGIQSLNYLGLRYIDRVLLDYNEISDIAILNHAARWRREIMHSSGSVIDPIYSGDDYVVHVKHGRDYRVYYSSVEYTGQYWTAQRTWATADASWADFNAIVYVGHTRLS